MNLLLRRTRFVTGLAFGVVMQGSAFFAHAQSPTVLSQEPKPLPDAVRRLGQAIYSIEADKAGNKCVTFAEPVSNIGDNKAPRTTYEFHVLETQEDVFEALGIEVKAGYGTPQGISFDAELKRSQSVKRTSDTKTIALVLYVENEPYFRDGARLTDAALNSWKHGSKPFYLACGDSWTRQVYTGGRLIGLLTTSVTTLEEKQRVDETLGVKEPIGGVGYKEFSDFLKKAKTLQSDIKVLRDGTAQPTSTTVDAFLAEAQAFPTLVSRGTLNDRIVRIDKEDYSKLLGTAFVPPVVAAREALANAARVLLAYESEVDRANLLKSNSDLFEPFSFDYEPWRLKSSQMIAKIKLESSRCLQDPYGPCASLMSLDQPNKLPQPMLRFQSRVYLGEAQGNPGMLSTTSPIRGRQTRQVGYLLTEAAANKLGPAKPLYQEPSDARDPGRLWTAGYVPIAGYVLTNPAAIAKLGPSFRPVTVYSIVTDFTNLAGDHYLNVTSTRREFDGILDHSCNFTLPFGAKIPVCAQYGLIPMLAPPGAVR